MPQWCATQRTFLARASTLCISMFSFVETEVDTEIYAVVSVAYCIINAHSCCDLWSTLSPLQHLLVAARLLENIADKGFVVNLILQCSHESCLWEVTFDFNWHTLCLVCCLYLDQSPWTVSTWNWNGLFLLRMSRRKISINGFLWSSVPHQG